MFGTVMNLNWFKDFDVIVITNDAKNYSGAQLKNTNKLFGLTTLVELRYFASF
jgi:hypothetical protein